MPHPVLEKIDLENPYFSRKLIRCRPHGNEECILQLWLPVQLDNGGWVAAVIITTLSLKISAMPGTDPLDALLNAVAFARIVIDANGERFLFSDILWEGGGLPISLNLGFLPAQLADIESQALAMVDNQAKAYHASLIAHYDKG